MRSPMPAAALLIAAAAAALGCSRTERAAPPRPIEPTAMPTARPADAVAFEGHWYKAYDEQLEWHEAEARCRAMGGHLAVVTSGPEQAFITDLAGGRYLFLGATDEAEEGAFRWVDGSPWDYTCWFDGQPNNWGGSENYLATYDGGCWVDVDAEGDDFWMPTGFICEWDE